MRSGASSYPAVAELVDLAADARAILGAGTAISYAADWSEYFGHHPQDGSGDVFFHLDPLWADDNIDFVGIDNYMPLSDWRDGLDHLDAASCRRDHRPRLPAQQRRGWRGLRLVLRQRRRPRGAGPDADHRRRRRQAVGVPLQGPPRLVVEPAPQPAGRGRERRVDGVGAGEQADLVHRDRLSGGRPRAEPAECLLRPEVGRELPAVLLARLARRRYPAPLPRGGARILGRAGATTRCRASTPAG